MSAYSAFSRDFKRVHQNADKTVLFFSFIVLVDRLLRDEIVCLFKTSFLETVKQVIFRKKFNKLEKFEF
jgi:hypothetical protein